MPDRQQARGDHLPGSVTGTLPHCSKEKTLLQRDLGQSCLGSYMSGSVGPLFVHLFLTGQPVQKLAKVTEGAGVRAGNKAQMFPCHSPAFRSRLSFSPCNDQAPLQDK